MSAVIFHSLSGEARLRGSERARLGHLAQGVAEAAWDLHGGTGYERAKRILALAPDPGYLGPMLTAALEQEAHNSAEIARDWRHARTDYGPRRQLVSALQTNLRVSGLMLDVDGQAVHTTDLGFNTALLAGSDPVKLAAKIHGYCEVHCWVDGPDRSWLAGIMQAGLHGGLYRRGLWYSDAPDGPADKWASQGWDEVIALLLSRADEPVVMSYTVCDSFPNAEFGWMPPWPDGVPKRWDALSEEQQAARSERSEAWYDLDHAEQWRISTEALRARPYGRLTPESLGGQAFGPSLTIYDVLNDSRQPVAP